MVTETWQTCSTLAVHRMTREQLYHVVYPDPLEEIFWPKSPNPLNDRELQ